MIELSQLDVEKVGGGFGQAVQAILVGVSAFIAPGLIFDRIDQYANTGQDLSQQWFDANYPYNPNSNNCFGPGC